MKTIKVVAYIIVPTLIATVAALGATSAFVVTKDEVSFCVADKERINVMGEDIKIVVTSSNKRFEVSDSKVLNREDSEKDFSGIKIGQCYSSRLQGLSVPTFNILPNILQPNEIKGG